MVEIKDKESIPFRFKVSGNIIKKLGEESVSNKNIAILELIKNSYDAGAKKVEFLLRHEDFPDVANILISDDGLGMTLSDIENKWMNIATPNKSKSISNKKDSRPIIGEKGIGRLSSESLGFQTKLITKPINQHLGYSIIFDWRKYQKEDILVNEIINEGISFEKKKSDHGTIIEISNLKHDWSDLDTQKSLLKDLYLLNPPNKPQKDFKVIPKYKQSNLKKIRKSFLNLSSYSLKTRLIKGNIIRYEFSTINKKIKKGIIQIDNKLKCGDACFELFMYYRTNKYLKNALNKELSSQEIKEINELLDEYSGIKLYRDNFRIKPYGDLGNDWVGLELEAQNNSMCPRNHQIFAMVHINRDKNPLIKDTTTREGVIFNEEFRDLISFIKTSILKIFIDLRSNEEFFKKKARKIKKKEMVKERVIRHRVEAISLNPSSYTASNKFIDIKGDYPSKFYLTFEQEINKCYSAGLFNASFFLSRKIVESFIFDILSNYFPHEKSIWWDEINNQSKSLSPLIKSLKENSKRFEPNVTKIIAKLSNDLLENFRNFVNPVTHNMYDYISSKEEFDKFKINDILQLLSNIWRSIKSN